MSDDKATAEWDLHVVGIECVGCPAYWIATIEATEKDAIAVVTALNLNRRPFAISVGTTPIWVRPGDALVISLAGPKT